MAGCDGFTKKNEDMFSIQRLPALCKFPIAGYGFGGRL
jgi:hypothetical protein